MAIIRDPVSGVERDDFQPQRPIAPASTDELADRQRAKAEARLRSGEVLDRETGLVEGRRRFLEHHGLA